MMRPSSITSASVTLTFWFAPQVSPFQPLRVTIPCMPISGANGPGEKSEPAHALMPWSRNDRNAMQLRIIASP